MFNLTSEIFAAFQNKDKTGNGRDIPSNGIFRN